jgi:mannose-6-phosphate isomerase-like protein (cupin superfamily)
MKIEVSKIITFLIFLTLFISCKQKYKENSKSFEQPPSNSSKPKVLHYSKNQLDSILRVAVGDTSSIQNFGTAEVLDQGEGEESYIISKRTVEGHVEMHEEWDDVVIIRSGHGLLRTGRKVTGAILNGDRPFRNWNGRRISDFKEDSVSPGDFIIIPAMTAHQYIPNNHDTLTYWTIKIKRVK